MGENPKPKILEVKKLTWEEIDNYIEKGICFRCSDKWSKEHKLFILEEDFNKDLVEDKNELEEEQKVTSDEDELSLNIMRGKKGNLY